MDTPFNHLVRPKILELSFNHLFLLNLTSSLAANLFILCLKYIRYLAFSPHSHYTMLLGTMLSLLNVVWPSNWSPGFTLALCGLLSLISCICSVMLLTSGMYLLLCSESCTSPSIKPSFFFSGLQGPVGSELPWLPPSSHLLLLSLCLPCLAPLAFLVLFEPTRVIPASGPWHCLSSDWSGHAPHINTLCSPPSTSAQTPSC